MKEWKKVCQHSELAEGTCKSITLFNKSVAVFNVAGQLYAMENECPHRGGALSEGTFKGKIVTCPWHSWRFDVTTGTFESDDSITLPMFPVKVEADEVLVEVTVS